VISGVRLTNNPAATPKMQSPAPRRSALHLFLIILATVLVTAALTFWFVRGYIFPKEFKPVALTASEEQVLSAKLQRIDSLQSSSTATRDPGKEESDGEFLQPEAYSEANASRSVTLTERELNGMLAKNTNMAKKLAIDLSDDLLSARLLVPVDEDFPIMGGQILKVRAGMELAYQNERAVARLKGVTIMGVAVPNAWLGGMKNIDLVEHYGSQAGFWKTFSDGVEDLHIEDGKITLLLKE
jgi:hypothetical protein